ncbi:MAG: DUF1189 family protein [Candidatus Paceibacterota bacterium]
MRSLITTFRQTWYNPQFYRSLRTVSLFKAYRYLAGVFFVFSMLFGLAVLAIFTPRIGPMLDTIAGTFPDELEIIIENGIANSNQEENFFIPWPENLNTNEFEWIAITATEESQDIQTLFEEHNTLSVLTSDTLAVRSLSSSDVGTYPLSDIEYARLTSETVMAWVDDYRVLVYVAVISMVVLFIFLFPLIGVVWSALFGFVGVMLVYLVAGMRGVTLSFRHAYIQALYALSPALAVSLVLFFGGIALPIQIPLLLYILVIVFNIKKPLTTLVV